MKKILLLVAVEAEIGGQGIEQLKGECDICFVGVGKLRAFEATLAALVQGDIYIDSIFATEPELLGTGDEGCSIASSDNFIGADTPAEQRRLIEPHDCMDMESYAIVRATKFYARQSGKAEPKMYMLKVVSDACDGTIEDWESRVERLQPTLVEAAKELIEAIK